MAVRLAAVLAVLWGLNPEINPSGTSMTTFVTTMKLSIKNTHLLGVTEVDHYSDSHQDERFPMSETQSISGLYFII